MKIVCLLVILGCAMLETMGYPYPYYPSYGNMDSYSYGSNDNTRGGMVMSRYYNPYYNPHAMGGGMAAFLVRQQKDQSPVSQSGQYYQPDRRRQTQTPLDIYVPPQQNEVFYPQRPDNSVIYSTEATEIADPTEKIELATTAKSVVPEITEPEVPEVEEVDPAPKSKKYAPKKKPTKKPVEDESEEYDDAPKMPAGAFFPMFFGWGGRSGGGAPGGPMAVANAYSTGRGGVATSHATAYGSPRPDERYYKNLYEKSN